MGLMQQDRKRIRSLSISDWSVSVGMQIGEGHFAKIYIGELREPVICPRGHDHKIDISDEENPSENDIELDIEDVTEEESCRQRIRRITTSTEDSDEDACEPITTKVAVKFLKGKSNWFVCDTF